MNCGSKAQPPPVLVIDDRKPPAPPPPQAWSAVDEPVPPPAPAPATTRKSICIFALCGLYFLGKSEKL